MRALLATFLVLSAAASAGYAVPPSDPAAAAALVGDAAKPVALRVEAARSIGGAIGAASRDRVVLPLLAALADAAPDVRAAAAGALARVGDERALPRLVKRLDVETDASVLSGLLLAIGVLGSPSDAPAVVPFAAHAEARLRAAAAAALGDLGGETACARCLALLASPGDDPDWGVRSAAMLALARCGTSDDAGAVLVAYREGGGASRWLARASLASSLAALDPDPVPWLDRLVADPDVRVATSAASGFLRAGKPDLLEARLADAMPSVRAACAAAAADAGLRHLAPKILALATGDPDRSVRWSAALALSRLDDPASDALLVEGVGSDDPEVWAGALAECRRKTGKDLARDADACRAALAVRRAGATR